MAYIGKTPVIGNFVKLDAISVVDGQAAYTMQNGGVNFTSYDNVNQFLVSLNGILQSPTDSFTVSGSTLTFASNLSTGDVIDFVMVLGNTLDVGTPSDNTVTASKIASDAVTTAKINDNAVTSAKMFSTFKNGITEADIWRLTANVTSDGDITTNLERADDASYGKIGTGMTESSGVFTFPSTGIYLVQSQGTFFCISGGDNVKLFTNVTINNSSYDLTAQMFGGASQQENTGFATCLVDVTDTSNVKVKFSAESISTGSYVEGNTDSNKSSFTFIRLGDT